MSGEPTSPSGIVAVVLAAGAARRFGPAAEGPGGLSAKLLAPLDGRPLVVAPVIAALDAGCDRVRLVVPRPDDELALLLAVATGADPRLELVASPERDAGLARSLASGTAGLDRDARVRAVVVLLGDVPGVTSATVLRVAGAVVEGAPAARARHADGPSHPVALAPSSLARLADLEGDVGARGLLDGLGVVEVAVEGAAPTDVDTPADLERLVDPGPAMADDGAEGRAAAAADDPRTPR